MKKVVINLIFAFALILGLSQCKKKVETISSVPAGVHITLDVEGGDKVIVDPTPPNNPGYATVTFEDGDVIWVGNNGTYCGNLTYNGTNNRFEGTIEPTSDDDVDYLHFYFTGNKGNVYFDRRLSMYVLRDGDIFAQTDRYPVISYGRSTYLYNSSRTSYSATLQNYCSIMKFPIAGAGTDKAVTITGMNNNVTINFAANNGTTTGAPYTYSKEGNGAITLHSESVNEKWGIVLPQGPSNNAYIHVNGYNAQTVSIPAINTNEYHNGDIGEITLTATTSSFVSGLFSVDANGTQVYFSPGNLQYHRTDGWRFAPNQYEVCQMTDGAWDTSGWVDRFGWGTWGQGKDPLNPPTADADYTWSTDFQGTLDGSSDWFTLSESQWAYLYRGRPSAGDKYASASVCGINGGVFLPDDWDLPAGCTFTPGGANQWDTNIYDATAWALMEANGAVFLPAAGYAYYGGLVYDIGSNGRYWTRSPNPMNPNNAYHTHISGHSFSPNSNDARSSEISVRLVRNI